METTSSEHPWYHVDNENNLDSPSLLLHYDGIQRNIKQMIKVVGGNTERLIPHVKTYKIKEIVQMMMAQGITKFKCATIAEAEMLIMAGAQTIILAHQLVGPKLTRFIQLRKQHPEILICSLVDCDESAEFHNSTYHEARIKGYVLIDVNNGMNRTGYAANSGLFEFYERLIQFPALECLGLHIYDGHLRQQDFTERKQASDTAFTAVAPIIEKITSAGLAKPLIITGGTPSFTIHTLRDNVICSPGTCVLWDWGYGEQLPEQQFEAAAVLLTRIISKPAPDYLTVDLGHKAVASENPLNKRIKFLNLEHYTCIAQSEEHLVLQTPDAEKFHIGDILYGIPYHICPTVNLHEEVYVVQNNHVVDTWQVIARKRKITV